MFSIPHDHHPLCGDGAVSSGKPTEEPNHIPAQLPSADITELAPAVYHAPGAVPDPLVLARAASTSEVDMNHDYFSPVAQTQLDLFLRSEIMQQQRKGVPLRRLGILFKDITTWGAPTDYKAKTFARAVQRSLTGRDLYESWLRPWIRRWVTDTTLKQVLIRDITGLVRDGEMMLVLGRPGSGCTTFLRTITSNYNSYLGVDGHMSYSGGLTPRDIETRYRGDVAYIPEEDKHLPYLTVRQTLEFAFRCKQPRSDPGHVDKYVSTLARIFGISHVLDNIVGDEHIRGISGGERKRLSCVEALATDALVFAWDGSTRGLDSAATLDYVKSLRVLTDVGRKATIVSLYQISEEVWAIMDKVMLLAEGRMIFSGPIMEAKAYFLELGYECREGVTTADFLTGVTNPWERRFRAGWEGKSPKGAIALEQAFKQSVHYRNLVQEVDLASREFGVGVTDDRHNPAKGPVSDFRIATLTQKGQRTPPMPSYTTSFAMQLVVCSRRQWLYLRNNVFAMGIRLTNTVVNALVIGSVFWRQPATLDGAFPRGGLIFFSSLFLGFMQLAEVEAAFRGREIIERHRNFAFVRPSAVAVARFVVDFTILFLQTIIFVTIVYWMGGMKATVGAFLTFLLFIYVTTIVFTGLYRMYAAISPAYEVGLRYCTLTVLVFITLSGYTLSVDTIRTDAPWFGWLSYLNPVYYTFSGLMAAEFHDLQLICTGSAIFPTGPTYNDPRYQTCAISSSATTPPQLIVLGDDYIYTSFGYQYQDVWSSFSVLLGMAVALAVIGSVASEWFHWGGAAVGPLVYAKPRASEKGAVQDRNVEGSVLSSMEFEVQGDDTPTFIPPSQQAGLQTSTGTFSWQDVTCTVPTKNGEVHTLLHDTEGICRPGEMTAFIGASGAGKTTLLSALSCRVKIGTVRGSIKIDGLSPPLHFQRSIGFCEQTDTYDPTATIREAFTFSALLRQDSSIPDEARIAYVNDVMTALELENLGDALIGSLTLEQKRRTTIGVELCARPSGLLFLDEPTSGLDSQGAYNIARLLRKLANDGHGGGMLCAIHQASPQILEIFDHVLALNPRGRVCYYGPVKDVVGYFERRGLYIEKEKNVADLLIEIGAMMEKNGDKRKVMWDEVWRNSQERQALLYTISSLTPSGNAILATAHGAEEFASPTITQIKLLLFRLSRQYWRTPEYPYSRLFSSILHPLFIGFTFFQLDNSLSSLQARAFAAFLMLMIMPEFVNSVSFRLSLNTALFREREYPAKFYSPLAFALANIIAELPYVFLNTVTYWLMWYWPIGFPAGRAGYMLLMIFTFQLFSSSWGQWIAALTPDYTIAANIIPFFIIISECFNGVVRAWEQLPAFWKYGVYMMNPITYFLRGTLAGTMSGAPVRCNSDETYRFQPPPNVTCEEYALDWFNSGAPGYLTNPGATSDCDYCRYRSADEFLATLNVDPEGKWKDLGVLAAFTVLNWIIMLLLVCGGRGDGVEGIWRRVKQWWRSNPKGSN